MGRWGPGVAFALALAARAAVAIGVHDLGASLRTDMGSYAGLGRRLLEDPLGPHPDLGFWPLGTPLLVAVTQAVAGAGSWGAVAAVYALLGAATVALAVDLARTVCRARWAPVAVGALGVACWPLLLHGTFLMSETPFGFFVVANLWCAVRLVRGGTWVDALGVGATAGLGAAFRPQLLLGMVVAAPILAAACRWRELRWALGSLLVLVALESAFLYRHTGQLMIVSNNASFNLVFGRCHNHVLTWHYRGGAGQFAPVGLGQVYRAERAAARRGEEPTLALDPALTRVIDLRGRPGDSSVTMPVVAACVRQTGITRQLAYSATHVAMLWHQTSLFPSLDRGWSDALERFWRQADRVLFELPSAFGLLLLLARRRPDLQLLAACYLSLLLTVALFFGEVRFRLPYTFPIALLAIEATSVAARWSAIGLRSVRSRGVRGPIAVESRGT